MVLTLSGDEQEKRPRCYCCIPRSENLLPPTLLIRWRFLEKLCLKRLICNLTDEEKAFTVQLYNSFATGQKGVKIWPNSWRQRAKISGGLVIGLTCSRIISNALLK